MKRIGILMACGALTVALSACDDNRDDDGDGGITLMDSGPGEEAPGPPPTPDAGPPDSGPEDTCPPATQPAPTAAACAAETQTCIDDCIAAGGTPDAVNACAEACLDNDPNATAESNPCILCFSQAQIACATTNGCDEEWGEVVCCAQANCPDGSCLNSPTGPCVTQVQAFFGCANGTAAACQTSTDVCFPPPA